MTAATRALILSVAQHNGLDPFLVTAVVQKESSGNPWAWNPEPHYRYLVDVRTQRPFRPLTAAEIASEKPPVDFPVLKGDRDQEWWGQQASWGLMQVMGALARELGWRGDYLTQLCDPLVNLQVGCKHLKNLSQWAQDDKAVMLAGYNAGRAGGPSGALQRAGSYPITVLNIYRALQP